MPHTCHATACEVAVPPAMWGCRRHWYMVPKPIRDRVWKHYRAGQEEDWKPTWAYLVAAREAVIAVAEKEGLEPDTKVYDVFMREFVQCCCGRNLRRGEIHQCSHERQPVVPQTCVPCQSKRS